MTGVGFYCLVSELWLDLLLLIWRCCLLGFLFVCGCLLIWCLVGCFDIYACLCYFDYFCLVVFCVLVFGIVRFGISGLIVVWVWCEAEFL